MKIRLFEAFAGIGSQAEALKELGIEFESVGISDIDKHAIAGYEAIHGPVKNYGDITKIEHLPECDLLTYSYPCLTEDTLVQTSQGWMPIKDVKVGMMVETDAGLRTVTDSACTGIKQVMTIEPSCGLPIKCTDYHPFLIRKKYHKWDKNRRSYDRLFEEPVFVSAKDLNSDCYVGFPIPKESDTIPEWKGIDQIWRDGRKTRHVNNISDMLYNPSFWWTVGRYLADGWQRCQGGIVIAFGKSKKDQIAKIPFSVYVAEERTSYKAIIGQQEIGAFCSQFGSSADTKHIPTKYKHLPKHLAIAMLEGYLAGDGHYIPDENSWTCSTISPQLALDMSQLISYCYGVPAYIHRYNRGPTCIIEGRVCNQKEPIVIRFKKDRRVQDKAFVEDGWVWSPIRHISTVSDEAVPVYDITVDDRHCFNANGIIVKNCTSVSLAGKREGMVEGSGTASSLLWEVGRLLKDMNDRNILPEILLMENVDAVLNRTNKPEFDRWCLLLSDLGYVNSYTIMNAKDYGTPQNRKRIFMVSSLTQGEFVFPDPCPDGRVLRDVLEKDVPESFFLSEKRIATFKRHKERNDAKGNKSGLGLCEYSEDADEGEMDIRITGKLTDYDFNQSGKVYDPNGVSSTIRTPSGGGVIPKVELIEVGNLNEPGNFESNLRVYSGEGGGPTVIAAHPPMIESVGELDIPGWHRPAKEVVGTNGVAPCISTQSNNLKTKIMYEGELDDSKFQGSRRVVSPDGVSPTITAEHGGPNFTKVMIDDEDSGKTE